MVQFGGISLRQYVIPTFSILYIIFGTLLPIWNLRFIGSEGNISHNFPYPFSLIFIEFFFSTFIFCILNVIERFIIPYLTTILSKNTNQSIFKVNTVKVDPFTNQTLAFYGGDEIRRPGLFQAVDFNQTDSINDDDNFDQQRKHDTVSTISGLSQITQFSIGGSSNITINSNYTSIMSNYINTDELLQAKKTETPSPETVSLSIDLFSKSWCFDSNFFLKLGITFKSGILFGLTTCLFLAASMFVPFNLDILIHSFVLMLVTIYTKINGMESVYFGSIIFAIFAVISIVPFCIHPFHGDKLYWDNKNKIDGTEYIIISLICDFIGAILIFLNIISISNLCLSIKPSKMRFENDREPSIIEIAFFISLWSSFIALFPCIICDILFEKENILTTNIISPYNDNDKDLFELLFQTPNIFEDICISIIINTAYIFSFIACLSIMTILSVSILYEFIVVTHAVLYFYFISTSSSMQIYHTIGLICAYISCLMYLIVRIIENKRHLHLTWNEYFTRQDRINSNESFKTLLSHGLNNNHIAKYAYVTKEYNANNNSLNGKFQAFSDGLNNNNNNSIQNDNTQINFIKNAETNNDDSIFSIDSESSDENMNGIIEGKSPAIVYTPPNEQLTPKKFHGPNRHNNRYGLPSYVITPPQQEIDGINNTEYSEEDLLWHSKLIKENIEYYENSLEKKKSKKKKNKNKNLNKTTTIKTASLNDVDFPNHPKISDVI